MNDTSERDQPDQVPPGTAPPPGTDQPSGQQFPPPEPADTSQAGAAPHPSPDPAATYGPSAPPPPDGGAAAPPPPHAPGSSAPAPPHAGYPPPHGWHHTAPPKPGVIPLRPLNLGDIIDGAVSAMRSYPRVMIGVAAVVIAAAQLIVLPVQWALRPSQADLTGDPDSASEVLATVNGDLVSLGILLLAQVLLTGFLTVVVGRAVVARPASLADVWAEVKPRLLALAGITLITIVVVFVAVFAVTLGLVVVIVGGIVALGTGEAGLGLTMLLIVAVALAVGGLALWIAIRLALATPALILERSTLGAALKRSWQLVGGSWWRIFGIWVLAYLIANVLASIITIPFVLIGGGSAGLFGDGAVEVTFTLLLLTAIGNVIAYALTLPFQAGVSALLYTDQRIRREGLDIELARSAGAG